VEQFKKIQEAKEVLCDDAQRRAYDYWRNSHITVPWKTWHSISERSQPVRK
jgi:DnaJ-class molecular chaperone